MGDLEQQIKKLETKIWDAASKRDTGRFLELVSEDAVMVCGGYRCTGKEYSEVIEQFDLSEYKMTSYETVLLTDHIVQNHYVITTKVSQERNKDLEGTFHITSTWRNEDGKWKLVYNMDSRV